MKYTPQQYAEALYQSLEKVSRRKYSFILKRFVGLLTRNNDMSYRRRISEEFERIYNKKRAIQKVGISTATVGDARVVRRIFGKKFDVSLHVDPALVGGVTVRMGDTLVDTSIRSRFRRLHASLVR